MRPLTKQSVSRGPLHPAAHSMWQQSLGLVPKQRPLHCGAHTILVTARQERAGWTEVNDMHLHAYVRLHLLTHRSDTGPCSGPSSNLCKICGTALRDRQRGNSKGNKQQQQRKSQWLSTLTSVPVVLDFDRSVVVPDDVPPVDPRAVPQVLVVDNVDASLQNLCHIKVEGKLFLVILETGLVWFVT